MITIPVLDTTYRYKNPLNSFSKIRNLPIIVAKLGNHARSRAVALPKRTSDEALSRLFEGNSAILHLIGVGNPMRKDDSVGIQIIRELSKRCPHASHHVIIHSPGKRVESIMSKLDYERDQALIFDAVECNSVPGSIVFAALSDSRYGFFATHNIPLKTIPHVSNHLDRVFVLGIQPSDVEFGEGLSSPVQKTMKRVVEQISKMITEDH